MCKELSDASSHQEPSLGALASADSACLPHARAHLCRLARRAIRSPRPPALPGHSPSCRVHPNAAPRALPAVSVLGKGPYFLVALGGGPSIHKRAMLAPWRGRTRTGPGCSLLASARPSPSASEDAEHRPPSEGVRLWANGDQNSAWHRVHPGQALQVTGHGAAAAETAGLCPWGTGSHRAAVGK